MKILYIIGNGFDICHGINSKYSDYHEWLVKNDNSIYEKLFNWKHLESEEERTIPEEIMEHVDFVVDKYIYNCVNTSFIQRLCQLNGGEYPNKVFETYAEAEMYMEELKCNREKESAL